MKIGQILEERGTRYGEFEDQSFLSQALKYIMRHGGWDRLGDDQKEALEMMAVKMARILNGDPDHIDSERTLGPRRWRHRWTAGDSCCPRF